MLEGVMTTEHDDGMDGPLDDSEGDECCAFCGWNIKNTGCSPGYCTNACPACGELDNCQPDCEG